MTLGTQAGLTAILQTGHLNRDIIRVIFRFICHTLLVAEAHAAAHTMSMAWWSMTSAYSSTAAAVTLFCLLGAASGDLNSPGQASIQSKNKRHHPYSCLGTHNSKGFPSFSDRK